MTRERRILIVEDSDDDYAAMMWAWEKAQIKTPFVRYNDGESALEFLKRSASESDPRHGDLPALVLLDLNLQRQDGRAVLAEIKIDCCLKSIPVVIMTTSANPKDLEACYALGANSYIVKPFELTEFKDTLQKLVAYWMEVVRLPSSGENDANQKVKAAVDRR
jgi:CheY-like chemotaxis protein